MLFSSPAPESATFKGYYLKDRYGSLIMIRTTRELPDINTELTVTGVAMRDADERYIFLTETDRNLHTPTPPTTVAPPPTNPPATLPPPPPPPPEPNYLLYAIIGAIGLLFLALIWMMTQKKASPAVAPVPPQPIGGPDPKTVQVNRTTAGAPSSDSGVTEYKTVKVYKTTKMLPGKLIVVENGAETDTLPLYDQSGRGEIEIGRDSPDMTGGIRIKDRTNTMSRRQGQLQYSAGSQEFRFVNLAGSASNPTILNGREMGEKESVLLKDGDSLLMGNLQLKFRKR